MIEFYKENDFYYGKQVIGPDFKNRIFVLFCIAPERKGFIESVNYFVAEYVSATIWGFARTKSEAISKARENIRKHRRNGTFLNFLKDGCKEQRPYRKARAEKLLEIQEYLEGFRKPKPIKNSLKKKVWEKSDGKCHYCRIEITEESGWHLEHKQPRTRGGTDELHNLAVSCPTCNLQKNDMTEAEFFNHRKFKSEVAA